MFQNAKGVKKEVYKYIEENNLSRKNILVINNCTTYIVFETKQKKIDYLNTNKNSNICECINTEKFKMYFDIDFEKNNENIKYTIPYLDIDNIIDDLINELNKCFKYFDKKNKKNKIFNKKNFLTYVKHKKKEKVNSIHIIVTNIITTKEDLKFFVKYSDINNIFKEKYHVIKVDDIYRTDGLFYLPYQKKKEDTLFFEPYNLKEKEVEEYLIIEYEEVKEVIFNQNIIKKKEEKDKNKIIINDNKDIIILNNSNLVIELLDGLPNDYFISKKWCLLSRQIILNNMDNINKWLENSAIKSNNKYTIEQNIKWLSFVKNDIQFKTNNIQQYLNKINKEYKTNYFYDIRYTFNETLYDFLIDYTKIDKKIIQQKINDIYLNKNNNLITLGDWFYNYNKCILFNENQVINYNIEVLWKKKYGIDTNNFIEIDRDDMKTKTRLFLESENKIMGIKALWGCGKTYYCLKEIIEYATTHNKKTLIITENNSLNRSNTKTFNGNSHLDNTVKEDDEIFICSLESLKKQNLILYQFDYIILDEYESIIQHFNSPTFTVKDYSSGKVDTDFVILNYFKSIIQQSEKIICLDADLSIQRMEIIECLLDVKSILYKCIYNPWSEYIHNIYEHFDFFQYSLFKDIMQENKKIAFACMSKKYTYFIFQKLISKNKNINILLINGEGITLYKDNQIINHDYIEELKNEKNIITNQITIEEDKDEEDELIISSLQFKKENIKTKIKEMKNIINKDKIIENYDDYLISQNIQVVIYSPSIKTGISINKTIFHKTYAYGVKNSCCSREYIQMFYRQRSLIDKEINIYCQNFENDIDLLNEYQIDKYLVNNIKFRTLNLDWNIEELKQVELTLEPFYKKVKISNIQEYENTQIAFNQEVIGKLIYNHNIPINIINKQTEQQIENNNIDTQETDIEKYRKADIVDNNKYIKLLNQLKTEDNKFQKRVVKKYKDLRFLGFNNIDYFEYNTIQINKKIYNHKKYSNNQQNIFQIYDTKMKYYQIQIKEITKGHKIAHSSLLSEYINKDKIISIYKHLKLFQTKLNNNEPYLEIQCSIINKIKIIKKITEILKIDVFQLQENKIIYTNKQMKDIINNNIKWFQNELHVYFNDIYKINGNHKYNFLKTLNIIKNNDDYKKIKTIIKEYLYIIGITFQYISKSNTSRDIDKLEIFYKQDLYFKTKYYKKNETKKNNNNVLKNIVFFKNDKTILNTLYSKKFASSNTYLYNIQNEELVNSKNGKCKVEQYTLNKIYPYYYIQWKPSYYIKWNNYNSSCIIRYTTNKKYSNFGKDYKQRIFNTYKIIEHYDNTKNEINDILNNIINSIEITNNIDLSNKNHSKSYDNWFLYYKVDINNIHKKEEKCLIID